MVGLLTVNPVGWRQAPGLLRVMWALGPGPLLPYGSSDTAATRP